MQLQHSCGPLTHAGAYAWTDQNMFRLTDGVLWQAAQSASICSEFSDSELAYYHSYLDMHKVCLTHATFVQTPQLYS